MAKYTLENYTLEKYYHDLRIVEKVETTESGDFVNFNWNADIKRGIVEEVLGYKSLKVGSDGKSLSIEECTSSKVNEVLKSAYNSAKRRIEEFGDPLKRLSKQNSSVSDDLNRCF